MAIIEDAWQWAVDTCENPNVGYSQQYRNQQTVNGITYYDCSSFIWYALKDGGGFDVVRANGGNTWPFTTFTMGNVLINLGFELIDVNQEWKAGDINLNYDGEHVEMTYAGVAGHGGQGRTMGAHTDQAALPAQVSVNNFISTSAAFPQLYRYSNDWIWGNYFLNQTQMEHNATLTYNYLSARGWSVNAIAALLGNMQTESTINPGIWEGLIDHNMQGGFGLVQWTPATKYIDWADQNEPHWINGYTQLDRIIYEADNGLQWFSNPSAPIVNPPITFKQFTTSTLPPETLANYFLWYYEHPGTTIQPQRATQARAWFEFLGGISPIVRKRGLKVWQMIRYHY